MKKLLSVFLLLCLIAPFVVTFSYLKVEKHQLKRSIKHKIIDGIAKEELVLLKFSNQQTKEELNWQHSKEFEYKGEMYDIVSKQTSGDSIYYWCWWDKEETKLNQQLSALLNNSWKQNPKQQQQQKKLIQYTKNWFSHSGNSLVPSDIAQIIRQTPFYHNTSFSSRFTEVPSPPPQQL